MATEGHACADSKGSGHVALIVARFPLRMFLSLTMGSFISSFGIEFSSLGGHPKHLNEIFLMVCELFELSRHELYVIVFFVISFDLI